MNVVALPVTPRRRLQFVASDAFLEGQPSTPEWVIYPLAMKGSSIMLYGRQGIGKSSVTMQLAHSLISGEPFLGFRVHRTGPVLYLQLDMAQQETRRVIERAQESGLDMQGKLHVPALAEGEETLLFNILNPADAADLKSWCDELKPVAVIVDTIHDAYEASEKQVDVNAQIRKIHRSFRQAIGSAVLVFLNHMRKQPSLPRKGDESDDEDAYMGGQAWEGLVASSLQLKRRKKDQAYFLGLRKLRLDTWPSSEVPLQKTDHGFFSVVLDYRSMLMQWPDCLDVEAREQAIAAVKTKADVFRDIALITGENPETIRQQFYRNKGADYPWLKYLKDAE